MVGILRFLRRSRSRLSSRDREMLRCVIVMLRMALDRLEQIYRGD